MATSPNKKGLEHYKEELLMHRGAARTLDKNSSKIFSSIESWEDMQIYCEDQVDELRRIANRVSKIATYTRERAKGHHPGHPKS